jgi:hypothetical protein
MEVAESAAGLLIYKELDYSCIHEPDTPDMDTYFTEINHVLLASRGYEYDGFLFS